VGVSALVTLATHDQRQVAVAPAPVAVQVQVNEEALVELEAPPELLEVGRLNEFIEQNLAVKPQNGSLAPNAPIWNKLAAAKEDQFIASPINPGPGDGFDFREAAPDGGLLVGFFASSPDELFVHYLQPIYVTTKGEKVGKARGEPKRRVVCIKAKENYAIGAIDVRSGNQGLDSFAVRFMRVGDDSLDIRDAYISQRIGGGGGPARQVGGNGAVIVGIHGRALNKANFAPAGNVTTLGVLSLP
jgi:hypothetical protein